MLAVATGHCEQPVYRCLVSKVKVVQLAPLVNAPFQCPARFQLQGDESVGITTLDRGLPDQEWCPLLGVEGFEFQ